MLSLEGFKQGICCSISGQAPFQMHLLMLFKVADLLRCEQLVSQRWLHVWIVKISNIMWLFLVYGYLAFLFLSNDILYNQGAAIDRILGEIVHSKSMTTPIDYVLCIGHFLAKVSFVCLLMNASGVYFVLEASCLIWVMLFSCYPNFFSRK